MRVGCLQYAPAYLDVEANLATVERMLEEAHVGRYDLLVLPELFATGYFFRSADDLDRVAEPVPDGPVTRRLEGWARASGTTLVAGVAERAGGRIYNSAAVVTPQGWLATYRKVHLFYEETQLFAPGDLGLRVFDVADRRGTPYRLGVMVCFDWYFPEAARTLAMRGADLIAHPSNLVLPHCPRSMPVRAIENHVFTATANRIGQETRDDETLTFIGQSVLCSPQGDVLARAGREDVGVVGAEFDAASARARALNAYNHPFDDRRPDVYA